MTRFITYRHLGVAILLVALFIQSFTRVLIISDYYVNTESYAINCENKALVEMHCDGQCQLMKKLEKEDQKDQSNPQRNLENNNKYFLSQELSFVIFLTQDTEKSDFSILPDPKTIDRPHSIFRPPMV
ncbi:hypothetical protein [Albibacterium indicum]|uniref:hypothetical protein n=1 Tax=Albibacterium indicum TaxID=2292082 RepID=UPI000E47B161|nr:hypothetical protein [Pedobacter indicus]